MNKPATRAIAVVLPVLLLGLSGAALLKAEPLQEHAFDEVTGDLLIIGNSKAGTDLDPELLSKNLGLSVGVMSVPGANPEVWNLLLENRVHQTPEVLFFVAAGRHLLTTDTEDIRKAIATHGLPHQTGQGSLISWKASSWRTELLDKISFFIPSFFRTMEDYNKDREKLFAAENINEKLYKRVIPVVQNQKKEKAAGWEDTALPRILEKTRQDKTKVILILPPIPTKEKSSVDEKLIAMLNDYNVCLLDYSLLNLPLDAYADTLHLGPKGQATFTQKVINDISAFGGLSAPFPKNTLPIKRVDTFPSVDWELTQNGCFSTAAIDNYKAIKDFALIGEKMLLRVTLAGEDLKLLPINDVKDCKTGFAVGDRFFVSYPDSVEKPKISFEREDEVILPGENAHYMNANGKIDITIDITGDCTELKIEDVNLSADHYQKWGVFDSSGEFVINNPGSCLARIRHMTINDNVKVDRETGVIFRLRDIQEEPINLDALDPPDWQQIYKVINTKIFVPPKTKQGVWSRFSKNKLWIYPGDKLTIPMQQWKTRELRRGIGTIQIGATSIGAGKGTVEASITCQDRTVELPLSTDGSLHKIPLNFPSKCPLSLNITSDPDAPFMLLEPVTLFESAR